MRKFLVFTALLTCVLLTGCSGTKENTQKQTSNAEAENSPSASDTSDEPETFDSSESQDETEECTLEDGTYTADFTTDSSMFHANEACDGKGTLTVKDGKMIIHVSFASKNIVNLYVGSAKDAQKDGAELLMPTTDTVTYSDGMTEEVYGFDIPVKAIDKEFDVAIIGTKNKWYDHKVKVSNPVKE